MVPAPDPDYEQYVAPVNKAVRRAALRHRLSSSDADDLRSEVWLRLLARRGRILRKLRGVSRIDTYLAKVATNLVLDRRNAELGKWRPSAAARRGGPDAVIVDRLMTRDGLSQDAVEEWLRCARPASTAASRAGAFSNLPLRHPRRFISVDKLSDRSSTGPSPLDAWCASESAQDLARLKAALVQVLRALAPKDRELLTQRYFWRMSVAEIAAAGGAEAKPLYRYFETLLRRVRQGLAASGFDGADARRMLAQERVDWDCGLDAGVVSARLRPERSA